MWWLVRSEGGCVHHENVGNAHYSYQKKKNFVTRRGLGPAVEHTPKGLQAMKVYLSWR